MIGKVTPAIFTKLPKHKISEVKAPRRIPGDLFLDESDSKKASVKVIPK